MTALPHAPTTSPAPQPPLKRWRRVILFGAVLSATVALSALLKYLAVQSQLADQALAEAIAEADRLDPGWRLMELEAGRKPGPDEQDSAPVVKQTATRFWAIRNAGTLGQDPYKVADPLESLHPTQALTPPQTADLRKVLQPVAPLLEAAHKLAELPQGRFPCNVRPDLNWVIANADYATTTAWLLQCDANLHLEDNDGDGGWRCCLALVNTGRSLGDEPLQFIQMRRAIIVAEGVRLMERTLAQREVPAPALAEAQGLVEDELGHPALLISLRGCRGVADHCCTLLEAGNANVAKARQMAAGSYGPLSLQEEVRGYFDRPAVKPAHAWLLRYLTQAVEIAKRPEHEIEPALAELEKTLADAPELARLLAPQVGKVHAVLHNRRAQHRCAVAALAVERYRLAHNGWPASLDALVAAKLLTAVPVDPYDGKALRYRALPDGVVVYAVGPDSRGNGEALDANAPVAQGQRLEFRLWHPERRGQGR